MANETDPFWIGQQKINGKLCRVDWLVLEALREASRLLQAGRVDQADPGLASLNALIDKADQLSARVALENPPGCVPTDRSSEEGGGQ